MLYGSSSDEWYLGLKYTKFCIFVVNNTQYIDYNHNQVAIGFFAYFCGDIIIIAKNQPKEITLRGGNG